MNYNYDMLNTSIPTELFKNTQEEIDIMYPSLNIVSTTLEYCINDIKNTNEAYARYIVSKGFTVKKAIFNDPATIIYWNDDSKTVVKCQPGDVYDPEKGFVMAYLKKLLGNDNTFNKEIAKWVKYDEPKVNDNKPLTTKELLKMDGMRVWCSCLDENRKERLDTPSCGWHIVDVANGKLFDEDDCYYLITDNGTSFAFKAYLKPPETRGATNEHT